MTETPASIDVDRILAALTLEEKAALTTGADTWRTVAVERLGLPAVMLCDGPHGLRKQTPDAEGMFLRSSYPATCFPTAAALASTWDPALLTRVGEALGLETRAHDVQVLLGPGANIKRTPLCGRNFEYLSEDPVLSGDLAGALIRGIQSQGVGTSLKHYAANNQETDRRMVSADVDERTLREIYLTSFERAVVQGRPWTLMCAYNRINGVHASQNRWLLTEVLRDEWGFDGLVMSDWDATHDRAAAVRAGLDLTMPTQSGTDHEIVDAVRDGRLAEADLDTSVRRVLQLVDRSLRAVRRAPQLDHAAHHALAREAAAAGSVLLKNDDDGGHALLPLDAQALAGAVVVGEFARTPRYQGAGSSQVNPTRLDTALDALRAAAGTELAFVPGFTIAGGPDGDDAALLGEAVAAAEDASVVLAFLGLPGPDESEGYDRPRLGLPDNQVAVIEALAAVNPRIVVVLSNGSAVSMPWATRARSILEVWLGGQAGGAAVADVLTGATEPGGRLAESIPVRLEDTPAYGNFPGEFGHVRYGEGVLVGYRWYDARDIAPAFPFGHGLGYTTFEFDALEAEVSGSGGDAQVEVRVRVTNTGRRAGSTVVQVYVGDPESAVARPVRELKAFAKVSLDAGEHEDVVVALDARTLSYWHPALRRWVLGGGAFDIEVGASSRDLRATVTVDVPGESGRAEIDEWSTIADWWADPDGHAVLTEFAERAGVELPSVETNHWVRELPLRVIARSMLDQLSMDDLEALLTALRQRRAAP